MPLMTELFIFREGDVLNFPNRKRDLQKKKKNDLLDAIRDIVSSSSEKIEDSSVNRKSVADLLGKAIQSIERGDEKKMISDFNHLQSEIWHGSPACVREDLPDMENGDCSFDITQDEAKVIFDIADDLSKENDKQHYYSMIHEPMDGGSWSSINVRINKEGVSTFFEKKLPEMKKLLWRLHSPMKDFLINFNGKFIKKSDFEKLSMRDK